MEAKNTSTMNVTGPSHVNGMDTGNQNNEFLNFDISQEELEYLVTGAEAPVMPPTPPVVRNELSTDNSESTRSIVGLVDFWNPSFLNFGISQEELEDLVTGAEAPVMPPTPPVVRNELSISNSESTRSVVGLVDFWNPFGQITEMLLEFLSDNTLFVIAVTLLVYFMTFLLIMIKCKEYLIKRISYMTDLPDNISGISLSGIVTSVMDGDGFKFYHVPWFRSSKYTSKDPKLKIRLAGIDAPECASQGMPAQPFADEAKWHLNDLVFRKKVSLKLIKRDIYNRLLAVCFIRKSVNVNLKMVEDGLACVYKGADAQYGGMLNDFKRCEASAYIKKLGMWNQNHYVSPMDHKRKYGKDKGKITHVA